MSVALMSAAFKAPIPATQKLVMLAVCDAANDQGECYPSVATLKDKCSLTDRSVQKSLTWLEEHGYLSRAFRTGRSVVYHVNDPKAWPPRTTFTPERGSPPNKVHPTPERRSPPPPNDVHPTPERGSPITINEPSIEPSRNQKKREALDFGGADPAVVADFLALRRGKRAAVTATGLERMRLEAAKAGMTLQEAMAVCCERGWAGFKAAWVAEQQPAQRGQSSEPEWRKAKREAVEAYAGPFSASAAARRAAGEKPTLEVIDGTTRLLG